MVSKEEMLELKNDLLEIILETYRDKNFNVYLLSGDNESSDSPFSRESLRNKEPVKALEIGNRYFAIRNKKENTIPEEEEEELIEYKSLILFPSGFQVEEEGIIVSIANSEKREIFSFSEYVDIVQKLQ